MGARTEKARLQWSLARSGRPRPLPRAWGRAPGPSAGNRDAAALAVALARLLPGAVAARFVDGQIRPRPPKKARAAIARASVEGR